MMSYRVTCVKILVLLGCLVGLVLQPPAWSAPAKPAEDTFIQEALINGKLVQRWNDSTRTIPVTIEPLRIGHPATVNIVKSAFADWEKALGGRIRFVYTIDPTQSDVVVKWRLKSMGMEVGHQSIRWNNNTLTDADIEISLSDNRGRVLSPMELKYVALHEIGHMLGIKGHSKNPNDIMFPTLQPRSATLSARDIATMRALYQRKPDITNPQGVHLMQYRQFVHFATLGEQAFNRKDYSTAYMQFLKAQRYYPQDSRIPYYVGISAYNVQRFDVAIPNLEKALQQKTNVKSSIEFYLANALMASGSKDISDGQKERGQEKLNQARKYYNNFLKNPDSPADLRKVASSYLSELNSTKAE